MADYSDLQEHLDAYHDGLITAKEAMYRIVKLDANGRELLKKIVFEWLDGQLMDVRALERLNNAFGKK
jgi:myo-inositol catabolism protein IolC